MSRPVRYSVDTGGIARIAVDNPPVNALSHAVRAALWRAVQEADSDPRVRAILLAAEGRTFPAGADISEFHTKLEDPWMPELCDRIEACSKPVIAVLHGTALGGGLELALAAHYRIALAGTRVGLPEVTLGILPGAGGTQRLPRLAGAEAALEIMLVGKPLSVAEAERLNLVDRVVRSDLEAASHAYAQEVLDLGEGPRPTRARRDGLSDPKACMAAIARHKALTAKAPIDAPRKIVDCVEAALLLPFDAGMAFEGAAFDDCVSSTESHALRHAFFAERLAGRFPEAGSPAPEVRHIAVHGAGPALAGIAVMTLDAGLPVTLVSPTGADVVNRVEHSFAQAVSQRRMSAGQRGERLAQLSVAQDAAALSQADVILSVLPGPPEARERALKALADNPRADAVLALSGAARRELRGLPDPARAVGLYLPPNPQTARLAEVLVTDDTAPGTVAAVFALFKRLGRVAVRSSGGPIGQTLNAALQRAADDMVIRGADPYAIDAALRAEGFTIGPYQRLDRDNRAGTARAFGMLLAAKGWTGRAAGRGFYSHETGGEAVANPGLRALLKDFHAEQPETRAFEAEEILQRLYAAMANAGARLLSSGAVQRPSDVDAAMMLGQGFPRWIGGPMAQADSTGLLTVKKTLDVLCEEDATFWAPAPLFIELIKNGRQFADLNSA